MVLGLALVAETYARPGAARKKRTVAAGESIPGLRGAPRRQAVWMGADDVDRRLVRRLRIALVALAMLSAVCVLAVGAVLVYWHLYLLGPSEGPFARGPFLTRVNGTSAELAWTTKDSKPVELRALAPDGSEVVASGGRFSGLRPGTRYAWTASIDGIARAAGSFQTAPPNLRRPIRFVAFGDYGSGNDHEWAVG